MPTATGLPTSTANPTGVILTGTAAFLTGTPTVTVTPTLSGPSLTPTTIGIGFTFVTAYSGFGGLSGNAYANMNASTYSCTPSIGATGIKSLVCDVHFSGVDNYTTAASNASFTVYGTCSVIGSCKWYWDFEELSAPVGISAQYKRDSTSGPIIAATGNYGPGTNGAVVIQMIGNNPYVGSTSANYRIKFSTEPISIASPTPTATASPSPVPTSSSYCSVVDASADESGFGLPVITGGTPVCGGAGGFIIPFSWFQLIGIELDDLIVPFIDVCFVPTSFGVLTIAGNTIDLDIAAYILGALFLLSLVL